MAAADSILRLKVDSQEFDNKVKSATDGLSRLWDAFRKGKNSLGSSEAELLKYVQSLGTMETRSATVRGKISELSKAFIELQSRYNQMSQEQKNSDVGKAWANSMEQLKQRTIEAKKELNDLGEKIGNLRQGSSKVGGMGIDSLVSGLNNVNSVLSGGMGAITGMIGKAGPYGAAAAGVLALGSAFADLGKDAIEARKTIENLELNIGTLLGSAEKGRSLVKELQQYGVATPYDTEGLAGAARTMLAYGVSAERIMPLMRQLGDIAQGDTQRLNSLALAFGQMTAVGTVQKQDLNQMANAGFGFNQIAKSMGVTVSEFLDMVSKKKVSVEDIAKALRDATSAGGLFYRSAVNASGGLEGTFSNFEESLTNTKAQLGKLIEPAVVQVVNSLGEAIEGLTSGLGGSTGAAETFKGAGQALGTVIKGLAGHVSDAIGVAKAFGGIISEVGTIVSPVTGIISGLINKVSGLGKEFGNVSSNPFVNAIKGLFTPLKTLRTQLETLLNVIKEARKTLLGDTADEYAAKHGGDKVQKQRPIKAGDVMSQAAIGEHYANSRYGSVGSDGKWRWSAAGAQAYNKAHNLKEEAPKANNRTNGGTSGGGGNRKVKPVSEMLYEEVTSEMAELRKKLGSGSSVNARYQELASRKKELEAAAGIGPGKNTDKAHAETSADRAAEAQSYYNSVASEVSKFAVQAQQAIAANETAAMADSSDKRKKAIEDNRQKELSALDKQIDDLAKKEAEADQKAWLKQNPKKGVADYKKTANGGQDINTDEGLQYWRGVIMQMDTAQGKIADIYNQAQGKINLKFDFQAGNLDETQLNQLDMAKNTKEYVRLMAEREKYAAKANKTIDDKAALAAIDMQTKALADQNGKLQDRNALIAKWRRDAQGTRDFSSFNTSSFSGFASQLQQQISTADIGSTLYNNLSTQLADTTAFSNLIQEALKNGIDLGTAGLDSNLWQKILSNDDGALDAEIATQLQSIVDTINEQLESMDLPKIKLDVKTGALAQDGKNAADDWKKAASAIQSVGSAMQSIEDPAAKVAGVIAQAIAQIALGAGEAIAKGGKLGPFGWIAAAASVTATMISTIAAVRSATSSKGYARGGIVDGGGGGVVGGNSYSGDNVGNVRLNSGELVLNQAQQGVLADRLSDSDSLHDLGLECTLSGEDIRIALNRNGRRTGRGELVTSSIKLW